MIIHRLFKNKYWIILGTLFAFDDITFFANYGGPYLASPSWIVIILLLNRFKTMQISRSYAFKISFILLIVTCISLFQYSQISLSEVDQSILLKIIKNIFELMVYLIFVFLGFQVALKPGAREAILSTGVAFYATNVIGFLLEKYFLYFSYESFFHSTSNIQQRARGFRFEASSFGSAFLIASALILISLNGRKFFTFFFVLMFLPLLIVQSRGYVLSVLIVTLIAICRKTINFQNRSTQIGRQQSIFEVGMLLVMIFGLPFIVQVNVWNNFSASVSDTTRSMWSIMVFFVLLNFPLGMGFGNSVVLLPNLISDQIVPYMQKNFINGDYSEIAFILASKSDSGMYPKTLPGYIILVSGWVGAIIYLFLYIRIVKQCKAITPREGFPIYVGFFLLITVSSTYFGSSFSWDQAFLFGAVYGLIKKNESKLKEIQNAK